MRRLPWLSLALVLAALLACKKEEEEKPLPDPLPSAPTAETPAAPAAPPTTAAPAADTPTPAAGTPGPSKPTVKKDGGTTAPTTDGGATAQKDSGTAPSGGASAECLKNCQTALQTCLTPQQRDGSFGIDTTKCQAAFQACQSACK